jgi:Ferritin-like domain
MESTTTTANISSNNPLGRRAAMMFGGAALAGLAFGSKAFAQAAAVTDTDILNFALNLEYLEAQFYTLATTGMTIDKIGIGITGGGGAAGGTVTVKTNPMVSFTTPLLQQYAGEVALEEQNHVKFLQTALAANAVAMPNIDLLNSFNALAQAAGLGSTFDPFASETNFLLGAFIFEDVGVTAYSGAAGLISNSAYLDKAAGILAVEAYHAGSIRLRIFQAGSAAQSASSAIAATRATLDGTGNDDIGVGLSSGTATIVDADANAIAFSRTTTQVLKIVYGGGASGGAFFPNGLNGTIK